MAKARKFGINTPYVLFVDYDQRKIYMQYVSNSMKMRDFLNKEAYEPQSSIYNTLISILNEKLLKK